MKNPWLKISPLDYENHMIEVGQAQVLNELIKNSLNRYKPYSFALLGCSTGNGLEHIDSKTTKIVNVIDIIPEYLKIAQKRYGSQLYKLIIHNIDIENDELSIKNVELFFVGLVLEYVDVQLALEKIINTLSNNGVLAIVIQQTKDESFVSSTKYQSLEKLSLISHEVDAVKMDSYLRQNNMKLVERKIIKLTKEKVFISLVYSLK